MMAWEFVVQLLVETLVKQLLLHIFVAVALISMRILKIEVEKGSM